MHTPLPSRPHGALRTGRISLARLALCLAAPFAVGCASAQMAPTPGYAYSPGYVDLTIGSSDFSKPSNGIGIFGNDQRATAYSVSMGNYVFSPNWGVEVGYTDFGSVNRAGGRTTADGIHLHLIGRAPINPQWSVLGKVGTTYGRTDVSSAASSGVPSGSERDFGWSYGLGVEVQLAAQWSGVLLYEEHTMKFPGSSSDRISATKLGLRYHY
jgi:OOP family OmpA-OmpF porin